MIVWTRGYRPFIMGGNVNGPVGTELEVGAKIDLGKGYSGYLVAAPITGTTYVAEAETGAVVGPSIAQVRLDIAEAPLEVMRGQMENAREERKHVTYLAAEQFWRMLSRSDKLDESEPVRDDRTALEAQAFKDYAHIRGKLVCVDTFTATDEEDNTLDLSCDGGVILARVMKTNDANIIHWCDDWLDPEWEIQIEQCYGIAVPGVLCGIFVSGKSYNIKTGETHTASVRYPVAGELVLEGEFYD